MIKFLYSKSKLLFNFLWVALTLLIVFIDQITKSLVVSNMELYDEIKVIDGFFNLYYVRNPGAGLGLLANARWLFMFFTSFVIVFAIVLLIKNYFSHSLSFFAIVFILSGGIGNMIDRIFYGSVVDFFQFQIKYFDFIFNVADVFVTFGTIMFVIYYIFLYEDKKVKNND